MIFAHVSLRNPAVTVLPSPMMTEETAVPKNDWTPPTTFVINVSVRYVKNVRELGNPDMIISADTFYDDSNLEINFDELLFLSDIKNSF